MLLPCRVRLRGSQACFAGYYCPRGSTSSSETPCPAGTFNRLRAQGDVRSCQNCSRGSYCLEASHKETRCPPTFTTLGVGARSKGECACEAGSYLAAPSGNESERPLCVPCPSDGTACKVGTTMSTVLIVPGWWRAPVGRGQHLASRHVLRCADAAACIGGTEPSQLCANGSYGPYCSACLHGWSRGAHSSGSPCRQCDAVLPSWLPQQAAFLALTPLMRLVVVTGVGWAAGSLLLLLLALAFVSRGKHAEAARDRALLCVATERHGRPCRLVCVPIGRCQRLIVRGAARISWLLSKLVPSGIKLRSTAGV